MFRQGLSLRVRLNLMIVLTLLSILGLGTAFAVHNARRAVAEEIASSVNLTLQLLEASLTDNRDSMASLNGWLARIGRLDQTRHLRIQVWQAPEGQALRPPDPLRLPERNQAASFEGWPVPAWFAWSVAPSPAWWKSEWSDRATTPSSSASRPIPRTRSWRRGTRPGVS